ncbi:MAG TPA: DEAD/DEAH box helicase [Bryobacteraceae bacterium]|jgi:SNF2 family DNA or RNA helicase
MADQSEVTVIVDGDEVVVSSERLRADRVARLFFGGVLGATPINDGWRCPRRKHTISSLVVRVNTFLESKSWTVKRVGAADTAVQHEIERKRSFQRTREAASAFRTGDSSLTADDVRGVLKALGWNDAVRELRDHQLRGLLHGLAAINLANFSVPGSGKTATTLATAATHIESKTIDTVIVIGPLSCFRPWENEVKTAIPTLLTAKRIRGTAAQRRSAYSAVRQNQLILLSYATATSDRLQIIDLCRRFRVMLVVDESHRVKRFRGGTWAPALLEIAKHARVRMILSGTPMPQSGKDLYSQINILWPAGELTGPRETFGARVDRNFPSILHTLQPFISRTPKSALGLDPYQVTTHDVPITDTQAEIYQLIEGGFRKRLEDAESWRDKLDALKRARPIRLLQAATNPDVLNSPDSFYRLPRIEGASPTLMERLAAYRQIETPAKSLAALNLIREIVAGGQKVVCWSNFVRNLDQFSRIVSEQLGVPCFQIDGRVPAGDETENDAAGLRRLNPEDVDTRERIIDQFLTLDSPAVLVTNPASCSESISLHSTCHNAIYLDRTYDCALFLQSIDRIHRLGLPRGTAVRIHILTASLNGRPTIDNLVQASLARKEGVMRQLLEGAELQPFNLALDPLESAQGDDEDLAALLRFLLGEDR